MRKENIKSSCLLIAEASRRIKQELLSHKNLPVGLFITIHTYQRVIETENNRIRKSIWRSDHVC